MITNFIIITAIIPIFIYILNKSKYLGKFLKVIDKPDSIRKLHKNDTPLIGGLALTTILILFNSSIKYYSNTGYDLLNIVFLFIIFFIGFLDDRINIKPYKKLLILFVFFYIYLEFNSDFEIRELRFASFEHIISLNNYSNIFFTICSLLFINSLNMTDGKNGLCSTVQIIIISFLIYLSLDSSSRNNLFEVGYIIFLIIFLFFNLKGGVFLGDSGVYVGSFIIINKIFILYESSLIFKVEQIFILLMIPGIDMFRVFLVRLMNKQSPFKADRRHFHHLLERKFDNKFLLTIYSILIIFPNLTSIIYPEKYLIIISTTISIYSFIIYKLYKQNNAIKKT